MIAYIIFDSMPVIRKESNIKDEESRLNWLKTHGEEVLKFVQVMRKDESKNNLIKNSDDIAIDAGIDPQISYQIWDYLGHHVKLNGKTILNPGRGKTDSNYPTEQILDALKKHIYG